MSILRVGLLEVPAFSGLGDSVNRTSRVCFPNSGPIPKGDYYVFDRLIVGITSHLRDSFVGDQRGWFSLYAIDGNIDDDKVLCENVMRSSFRLHPKQGFGVSRGCVTVDSKFDFSRVSEKLRTNKGVKVPGSKQMAYAVLSVI